MILKIAPLFAALLVAPRSSHAAAACDDSTPDFASLVTWTSDLRSAATDASLTSISCPANGPGWSNKRVLLIGVDGLRADAAAMLPLPNLHRLKQLGTHTFWANVQSSGTAVSGPGWASLLTGHEPEDHSVDGNGDLKDISYDTVLKMVKDTFSGMKVAASVSWHPLINDFFDHQDSTTLDARHLADNDEDVTSQAEAWIESGEYDLIFVDLDECDGAGHGYGFDGYANQYSRAVEKMDARVGRLLDKVILNSQDVEYLIVLTTDHGGDGTSHGPQNPQNRRIPFFVASNSPSVAIGTTPAEDTGSHMDLLPTVMHFLGGVDAVPPGLDGQVFGFKDYTRTPPPQCIPNPATCSCEGDQSDYRGAINKTISGKTCQRWDSQSPHRHSLTPDVNPDWGLEENYCRNPDGEPSAWCYTTDPGERFELCDVPRCGTGTTSPPTASPVDPDPTASPTASPTSAPVASLAPTASPGACPGSDPTSCGCGNVLQRDYRGNISETAEGLECQAWSSQSPHGHSRTDANYPGTGLDGGHNYCRNPDDEPGGAWCYTTNPDQRWAYCNVPSC